MSRLRTNHARESLKRFMLDQEEFPRVSWRCGRISDGRGTWTEELRVPSNSHVHMGEREGTCHDTTAAGPKDKQRTQHDQAEHADETQQEEPTMTQRCRSI